MKLYAKIAMISCAASLALVACSKNNPPETNRSPRPLRPPWHPHLRPLLLPPL